jgi:hypothetical protein
MNEMGKLRGIADKENWGVVEHPIKIALLSLEFDGKPLST